MPRAELARGVSRVKVCLIILGIGVLLMSGCAGTPATTSSSTAAASVEPLQSPNGAPPDAHLRGQPIAAHVLVDGVPYAAKGTLAYVRLIDADAGRPAFLTPRGAAVMATCDSGEYMPAPGAVYPAFFLKGLLADVDSVVVRFTRAGAGNRYWVYVRYERV